MHKLLSKKPDIINWLDQYEVKNYHLIENQQYGFVVNVAGDVELYEKNLNFIAVKFNIIEEDFGCSVNSLTSLYGAPEIVNGSFNCEKNKLVSLEYSPQTVKDNFCAANNQLDTIKGVSRFIGYNLWLPQNQLKNISSQELPNYVGGSIFMKDNFLSQDIMNITSSQILMQTLQIQEENKILNNCIKNYHSDKKTFKL